MLIWKRVNKKALRCRAIVLDGPNWADVSGRLTRDLDTGAVVPYTGGPSTDRGSEGLAPQGPKGTTFVPVMIDGKVVIHSLDRYNAGFARLRATNQYLGSLV